MRAGTVTHNFKRITSESRVKVTQMSYFQSLRKQVLLEKETARRRKELRKENVMRFLEYAPSWNFR